MRTPKLEEIKITTIETVELKQHLIKHRIGNCPLYVNFAHLSIERLEEVLTVMEMVLDELNISPIFPYPLYIITPHITRLTSFPTIKNEKELPKYFKIEGNRITVKEQKLLDKVEVVCSQIKNENVKKRLEDYRMNILPQKMIKAMAKEGQFLERVLEELDKN